MESSLTISKASDQMSISCSTWTSGSGGHEMERWDSALHQN